MGGLYGPFQFYDSTYVLVLSTPVPLIGVLLGSPAESTQLLAPWATHYNRKYIIKAFDKFPSFWRKQNEKLLSSEWDSAQSWLAKCWPNDIGLEGLKLYTSGLAKPDSPSLLFQHQLFFGYALATGNAKSHCSVVYGKSQVLSVAFSGFSCGCWACSCTSNIILYMFLLAKIRTTFIFLWMREHWGLKASL